VGDLSRVRVTGSLEPYVSGFVAELTERVYAGVGPKLEQLRRGRQIPITVARPGVLDMWTAAASAAAHRPLTDTSRAVSARRTGA
jgi:hypothetical protein